VVLVGVAVDVNKPPGALVIPAGILLLRVMLAVLVVLPVELNLPITAAAVAEVTLILPVKLVVAPQGAVELVERKALTEINMPLAVAEVAVLAVQGVPHVFLRVPVMAVMELLVITKARMLLQILALAVVVVPQALEAT
jgi:hypothetical protein